MDIFYDTDSNAEMFERVLNSSQNINQNISVKALEELVVQLVKDIMQNGAAEFTLLNNSNWNNLMLDEDQTLVLSNKKRKITMRRIALQQKRSKHRFCLIVYALAAAHRLLLIDNYCSTRELYYRDPELTLSQTHVDKAVRDLTCILQVSSSQLGILTAGKGLVAGPLRILLKNAEIIACSNFNGASLIPNDFSAVEALDTTADWVLLLEKETVMEHVLSSKLFNSGKIIVITGKGYPDMSTRTLVQRLSNECALPIYAIFDADPFGIEIMLVYRHGSKAMSNTVKNICCPRLKWLGVHPCEMQLMPSIKRLPMTQRDNTKLQQLLTRPYLNAGVRKELEIMFELQTKCEIEGLYNVSNSFFCDDYIINKIQRKLFL